jgi:hypothetical protein
MTTPNEGSINKPLDYCALQELYHSDQFSGGQIDGVNFNVSYAGGGPHQVGRVGYEPVTVAGVTVQKQAIAVRSEDPSTWALTCNLLCCPARSSIQDHGSPPRQVVSVSRCTSHLTGAI